MPSDPLWRHVFRRLQERVKSGRKEEETAACKLLQKVPIFQELSGRELHKIEEMLYGPRDWRAGEAIINQGDPWDGDVHRRRRPNTDRPDGRRWV